MDQILEARNCQARQWRIVEAGFVPCTGNIEAGDWVAGAARDETIRTSEAGSN